ncbi:MAG TPA: serine hydrolase domain-containing protein [Terriglobales bacterium]|nr:serine hydrolase domain-containing protein [Terriglobales bacterium]
MAVRFCKPQQAGGEPRSRNLLTQSGSGDLRFGPGTRFEYSNLGDFLLNAILEQISGATYEQLMKGRIFTPLGMNDSGFAPRRL